MKKLLRLCLISFVLVLACFALAPVAQAARPPRGEDRGNGNSAAEDIDALNPDTTGSDNTAHGWFSLFSNTSGLGNTADGFQALYTNSDGNHNSAFGWGALQLNTTGDNNTAIGWNALSSNTIGGADTATGWNALFSNTTGNQNTATGVGALQNNTAGSANTALGYGTLLANTTGTTNTAVGYFAGVNVVTASNVTCIGASVVGADVSNTTWIGNVYGVTTQSGTTAPVVVSDGGQLGTVASSERFKKDIATMDKASETILSLRPVTFHYKTDTKGTAQFGLIAEEVAKVNPALVLPDKEGKPYTVRYDAVNAMLLNEFLKEHRKVKQLETALRGMKERLAEQDAKIEKVSAQLATASPSLVDLK
jgi:hypothetical protein